MKRPVLAALVWLGVAGAATVLCAAAVLVLSVSAPAWWSAAAAALAVIASYEAANRAVRRFLRSTQQPYREPGS